MTWIVQNLWLIPALPTVAAGISAFASRRNRVLAATLAIGSMSVSFLLSVIAFLHVLSLSSQGLETRQVVNFRWFQFGNEWLKLGWMLDPLTAIMLVMVTFVGLLIFIYSVGYMEHDENFTRFFCFLALFAGAMLGVVIANSLLLLFMCWEIVGLTSYLLIGFWYHKPEAAAAAKKAFIVTRIGDLGFFIGMVVALRANRDAAVLRRRSRMPGTFRIGHSGDSHHSVWNGCLHRHCAADLLRRGRQIRPGPTARLAAGRDGRPHPGQRSDPRRHHGRRRRLPHRACLSADERPCRHWPAC